jgi:hypothetical protein
LGNQIYNNLLYGNLALNSAGGQIDCANDDHLCPYSPPNLVFGNTLVSAGRGIAVANMAAVITNNIIMSANNPILNNGAGPFSEDYNVSSVTLTSAHDITVANAGFVNSARGLYWLTSGSPAIGKASASGAGPVNFFGINQFSVTDIGFNQYSASYAADGRTLDPSGANPDYWANPTVTGTKPLTPQGLHVLSGTNLLTQTF